MMSVRADDPNRTARAPTASESASTLIGAGETPKGPETAAKGSGTGDPKKDAAAEARKGKPGEDGSDAKGEEPFDPKKHDVERSASKSHPFGKNAGPMAEDLKAAKAVEDYLRRNTDDKPVTTSV